MGAPEAAMTEHLNGSAKLIVFFDVETNVPSQRCRTYELLEFGAVALDAQGLGERRSFHTLIRPADLSCIDRRTTNCNTITTATVSDAPTFAEVADDIYKLLHGHVWAGHNILKFDILRIKEAFSKIGKIAPEPSSVIDTYTLLRRTFGKRAGNYKLATLANYCGYGVQEHRSMADVRLNIDVLRSCATMLFLESNYPDIFMAGMEVFTSSSVSEQSGSFLGADIEEQEVSSGVRSTDGTANPSLATKHSGHFGNSAFVGMGNNREQALEGVDSLRKSEVASALKDLELYSLTKTHYTPRVLGKGSDNCVQSSIISDEKISFQKFSEVSSSLKMGHTQEKVHRCHDNAFPAKNMAKENKVKLEKVRGLKNSLDASECPLQSQLVSNDLEEDLALTLNSLTLRDDSEGGVTMPTVIPGAETLSLSVKLNESSSTMGFGAVPFLLPSHVNPSSLELRCSGSSKTLYYNDVPLHLLEFKVRVRFTVNLSYAVTDTGKPKFSILIEPSVEACDIIRKCEELVKRQTSFDGEVKWLSGLHMDSSCWAARMSIGTEWNGSCWVYTTQFFRPTSEGLEKVSLDPVDASMFRSALPHGSIIDTGYSFYFFNFQNQAGIRLLAKHITLF